MMPPRVPAAPESTSYQSCSSKLASSVFTASQPITISDLISWIRNQRRPGDHAACDKAKGFNVHPPANFDSPELAAAKTAAVQ